MCKRVKDFNPNVIERVIKKMAANKKHDTKDGIHILDEDAIYLNDFIADMAREARLQVGAVAGLI